MEVMRLVMSTQANTPGGIQGAAMQAAQGEGDMCHSMCASPLVQRIGMNKQLLLVEVSADRDTCAFLEFPNPRPVPRKRAQKTGEPAPAGKSKVPRSTQTPRPGPLHQQL
jgi:hypothetical protein